MKLEVDHEPVLWSEEKRNRKNIFVCVIALCRGLQDLGSGVKPMTPPEKAHSPNHQTTRELARTKLFFCVVVFVFKYSIFEQLSFKGS